MDIVIFLYLFFATLETTLFLLVRNHNKHNKEKLCSGNNAAIQKLKNVRIGIVCGIILWATLVGMVIVTII